MEKPASIPSRSLPRFRIPYMVCVGIGVLSASVIGIRWGLLASDGTVPPSSATSPSKVDNSATRAVCIAHVDVEGGVSHLYPLQPGRVVKVVCQDNKEVDKGAPLFYMDDTLALQTVAEARADLAAARAQLKQASSTPEQHTKQIEGQKAIIAAKESELNVARLKRDQARRYVDSNLTREETYQMANEAVNGLEEALRAEKVKLDGLNTVDPTVNITRAEEDIKARQARLNKAEFALSECTLRAPCDGTVLRLLVSEGEILGANPQHPAVIFLPKKRWIIRAEVQQEFADRLDKVDPKHPQRATIQDDTRNGTVWNGHVLEVSGWYSKRRSTVVEPLQFNDVRTLECIIALDSPNAGLRIGQRVRVTLEKTEKKN